MSIKPFLKTNQRGHAHLILPLVVVVLIAVIGSYVYMQASRAASLTNADYLESGISGKCLDDSYSSAANGAKVDLYTCNKSAAQQWTLNSEVNNTFMIENANGSCLDNSWAKAANGNPIQMYKCNPKDGAQLWRTTGNTLTNPMTGMCIDDPHASTVNGVQLQLYKCLGNKNQKWTAVATGSGTGQASQAQQFGYSIHGVSLSSADLGPYLQLVKASNATTVRDDFDWANIEPENGVYNWGPTDQFMTMTARDGLSVLAIADYAPSWETGNTSNTHVAPKSAADYGAYVENIAERYGPNGTFWKQNPKVPYHALAGIELWNEPNLSIAWANPNAAAYTTMVKVAYSDIKKVAPSITVLAGSLAACNAYGYTGSDCTNGTTFLQSMYADGVAGSFDALSVHPYAWGPGLTASYILSNKASSLWSQMDQTPVSLRSLMVAHGDGNKKIWITEVGAPTSTGGISMTEQANLATQSIADWKSYSWAGNFYWYDIQDDCTDITNPECNYGAIQTNGTPKPVYQALTKAYAK